MNDTTSHISFSTASARSQSPMHPICNGDTAVKTTTSTDTSTTASTKATRTTAITTIKQTSTTTIVTTSTTVFHVTLDVDMVLFQRLTPVHYLILEQLKNDIPVKLIRVCRAFYDEIIPDLYRSFDLDEATYKKKMYGAFDYTTRLKGGVFVSRGSDEDIVDIVEPASRRKLDTLQHVEILNISDFDAARNLYHDSILSSTNRWLEHIPCIAFDRRSTECLNEPYANAKMARTVASIAKAKSLVSFKLMWPYQGKQWADAAVWPDSSKDGCEEDEGNLDYDEEPTNRTRPFSADEKTIGRFIERHLATNAHLKVVHIGMTLDHLDRAFPYIENLNKQIEIRFEILWEKMPPYEVACNVWWHYKNIRKFDHLSSVYALVRYDLLRFKGIDRVLPKLFERKGPGDEVFFQAFKDSLLLSTTPIQKSSS
ncbi:hypothetical protein I317_07983 [Kwoniella heveanensis CBS 569]|nr:hypothetical protein I317_07983 [Kwoniella heveanensis CBS 569]